ncbi:hypothetical protein JCM3770_004843 [Rhodotorula araucariae]
MASPNVPVHQTSKLLGLPVELLDIIFRDVCATRCGPGLICRALLRFHDEHARKRFRRVQVVGSDQLASYCRSFELRTHISAMCKSFKVVRYYRPERWPEQSEVSRLVSAMPNLRVLKLVDGLVAAFLGFAASSTAPFMPHLREVSLDADYPDEPDPYRPSFLAGLANFPSLRTLNLYFRGAEGGEAHDEGDPVDEYTLSVTDLRLVNPMIGPGSAALVARCTSLRKLDVDDYGEGLASARIVNAAAGLGTVTSLVLCHPWSEISAWKMPKQLKKLTTLKELVLPRGCVCRDLGSFETLRRLGRLERLEFGVGTVVSAAHLLTLLRGKGKSRSLRHVQLDNVAANLGDVMRLKWPRDRQALDTWLHGGWTLPKWTKTFSREGVEALVDAAEVAGVRLCGSAVEAPRIEDVIKEKKEWVKLKKRLRREKKGHKRKPW